MSEIDTVYVFLSKEQAWRKMTDFPVPNRAMNFGDGLFETMVFDGEKIRFFSFHLDRLIRGMKILKLEADKSGFEKLESWIADKYAGKKLRIRWNLFRSGSGRYTPETNQSFQTLHFQELTFAPAVKSLASFAESISLYPFPWSRFKTLNALPYVMAAQERENRKLDELILLDHTGKVAEASASNIFWRKGKKVYTPALISGCIEGVGRQAIISKIPRLITEGVFGPNDLLKADQVWVSNVTGVSYLEKIDSLEFSTEKWEPLTEIFQ
ncbi:aminotransferase class IV [Algoriphagus sp.]|jgi:branched-subunit amino acid aminotransferase/4-amino-4-deoxychorismate lyase|uniref:aminotransferase class IV n=1 Tax=Algoriphagus sp. TaxID=1872435 RepID=UPI00271EE9D8|nr:aminotransferase class IV [Algoriphagus sp.]MDO8968184.1 aminotransferase class IV [Algoriphagus sp.]MDP3202285.1 aminotransferase class IV [Algoriphagus sp.]